MIRIDFAEPDHPIWTNWRTKCQQEQPTFNASVTAWWQKWTLAPPQDKDQRKQCGAEKPKADPKVYAALKEQVYATEDGPFHGKCAYCDLRIFTNQPGDVDHFRPKGAVTNPDGDPVTVTLGGLLGEHPGYYWLAYNWQNLLPTCILCNRPSRKRTGGERIGKHDRFPVEGPFRASNPGEEVQEQPLLINPLIDDPDDHLELDASGVLLARGGSPRGQACIDMFGLNVRGLPGERVEVYKSVRRLFKDCVTSLFDDHTSDRARALRIELRERLQGRFPHTMAARLAIRDARNTLPPQIADGVLDWLASDA